MGIAVGAVAQKVERHDQKLMDNEEVIKRLEVQKQAEVAEQRQQEIASLRGAQFEVASAVRAAQAEMAVPPDAPIPQAPRVENAWDRQTDPTTLHAISSGMFTAEALVAACVVVGRHIGRGQARRHGCQEENANARGARSTSCSAQSRLDAGSAARRKWMEEFGGQDGHG